MAEQNSRRFLLTCSLLLCALLAAVLTAFGLMASELHRLFVPYQFFLIGVCVGALIIATASLIMDRGEWSHYRTYFFTVLMSVFLIVVVNSVIFKLLGGEQFVRRLIRIFLIVFLKV